MTIRFSARRTAFCCLCSLAWLAVPTAWSADPSPDPLTGKYYQCDDTGVTWDAARVDAQGRSFAGVVGHLVTISDAAENLEVHYLGGTHNKWIGLTDSTESSQLDGADLSALGTFEAGNTSGLPLPAPGTEPTAGQRGAGFRWVTGEALTYYPWRTGSPADTLGQADGVHTFTSATWQDAPAGTSLGQPGFAGPVLRSHVIEYETHLDQQRFRVIERMASGSFNSGTGSLVTLEQADLLLSLPRDHADVMAEQKARSYVVSFHDPDLGGGLADYVRHPFLLDSPGLNDDDFVQQVLGSVFIPAPGDWTFAIMSGDDFRLTVGENTFRGAGVQPTGPAQLTRSSDGTLLAAPGGSGETFYFPHAGVYDLELTAVATDFFAFSQLLAAEGNRTTFDASAFDLVGDLLNGGLAVMADPAADLDSDGDYDCADVNALVAHIAAGGTSAEFDLTGDGLVDLDDLSAWLADAGFANLASGEPYPFGDANLDGVVDVSDFNLWNAHKFTATAAWCSGDFNADGAVDVSDFNIWNAHKFTAAAALSTAGAHSLPEPASWALLILAVCGLKRRR